MTFSPARHIDFAAVKARHDIYDVASRYSELRKVAHSEYAGPCPVCGGHDRFHVNTRTQSWMCRNCTGADTWGDVIDLVCFVTGCRKSQVPSILGDLPSVTPVRPAEAKRQPKKWTDDRWQQEARKIVDDAAARLDAGVGRDYLEQRGIDEHTQHVFLLGYVKVSPPWDKELRQWAGGPAIVMPYLRHDSDTIMAIRYRHTNKDEEPRYINKAGSNVVLFGLYQLDFSAPTLVVVEGEFNALSVWQTCRDLVTVVSIGSQSVSHDTLSAVEKLSARFAHCIVW